MSERYFLSQPLTAGLVELDGTEAHHLGRVMRARPGDQVILFDGQGCEALAIIQQVDRDRIVLQTDELLEVDRELPVPLVLGVALPRGDRQKWLVEKLVELGVRTLVPLATERGVAQPTDKALDRLRRMVIEASKQCGRNRLMEIETSGTLDDFCQAHADYPRRLIAHPDQAGNGLDKPGLAATPNQATAAAVGPEGGFSPAEIQQAVQWGWQPTQLGTRILRVETAAMTLAAVLGQGAEG
jgi:16S rRNA (uracil1498-N3)-methyltransferase